jgi:hypothetical protein
MSWGAQNRSKDAKTPSVAGGRSEKPELDCCPIQPYASARTGSYVRLLVLGLNNVARRERNPKVTAIRRVVSDLRYRYEAQPVVTVIVHLRRKFPVSFVQP